MDNYNNYSNSLLELRRQAHENVPDSVLKRDMIIEVLQSRQISLNGLDEFYSTLERKVESLIDDDELDLIDDGKTLTNDKWKELFNKYSERLGLNELSKDRDLVLENMNVLNEEHFQQIVTLNDYLDVFEGVDSYINFEITKLDVTDPTVNVVSAENGRKFKLELPDKENVFTDDIAEERITTILQAEFNDIVFEELPAELIFLDYMNDKQYSLAVNVIPEEDEQNFHFWLSEDDDEPYYLEDIFDEKTKKEIINAIDNQETIHIKNPTNWFDFEKNGQFFNYLKEEKFDSALESKTYLYQNNNKVYINGWNFADINKNEIEISPYDYISEDSQSIIKDKVYELNTPFSNISLKDMGLEKLTDNSNHVITVDNDSNANEKVSTLILSTSAVDLDKKLIEGAYKLYSSFSDYYNQKFNIEENDIIRNHFNERFGNIEEHKEGLEQNLQVTPGDISSNFYSVRDDTLKSLSEVNLNVPPKFIPVAVRNDIESSFNRYKHFSNEEVTTMFNNLNQYENDSTYINSKSLKKLDETYLETLNGTKTQDFYNGMKEYAKLSNPSFFNGNQQEKREKTLENISTFKNYLERNNSLKTVINLDKNTISTSDNKVNFHFKDIENEPEKSLNTFSSYSKSINSTIDINI